MKKTKVSNKHEGHGMWAGRGTHLQKLASMADNALQGVQLAQLDEDSFQGLIHPGCCHRLDESPHNECVSESLDTVQYMSPLVAKFFV